MSEIINRQLTQFDTKLIEEFCISCKEKSFGNNDSLKSMKYEWCIDNGGAWFGTLKNNKIISLSGIHPFRDGWRGIFRGAQLEPRPVKGLDKYQKTAYAIWEQLPLEIQFVENISGSEIPIYITTNINHDASGTATRVHNLFKVLAKYNVVNHVADEEIFYTMQSIWQVNRTKYYQLLR